MGISAALAKQIAAATASGGNNYIKDGEYTFVVQNIKFQEGHTGACFIVDFRVLESKATRDDVKPNAVGTSAGIVWNFTANKDTAPGNTKAFICRLDGTEAESVTSAEIQQLLDLATSEAQPYRGYVIKCSTYRKWTKDKSKELTLPRWEHVPGQDADTAKAQIAALDAAA